MRRAAWQYAAGCFIPIGMRTIIICSFLLLQGCSSHSQAGKQSMNIIIQGIVVTEEGKPVPNAPVSLYDDASARPFAFEEADVLLAETKTASNGTFTLCVDVPIPKGRVKFVARGKKKITQTGSGTYSVSFDDQIVKNPDLRKKVKIIVSKKYIPSPIFPSEVRPESRSIRSNH